MRRIVVLALIFIFLASSSAFAGGAGNCVKPIRTTTKFLGVGAAFEYNYMNKRMNELDNVDGIRKAKVKQVNQLYGKGTIGIGDYINLYGKAGGANYDLEFKQKTTDWLMSIKLQDGIYTGGGFNVLVPVWEWDCLSFGIGLDVQGNGSLNDVKTITVDGLDATSVGGKMYELDGQNSLYLTCEYDIEQFKTRIIPYVGGYHSWMVVGTAEKLTYYVEREDIKYIKKHYPAAYDVLSFGVLVGVDVDIADYVNLNVEGRFVGETALTTGATIKF